MEERLSDAKQTAEACLAGKIWRWFGKSDMLACSEISSLS